MKIKVRSFILYIMVLALLCFMLWFNHRRAALFFIAAMGLVLVCSLIMHIKSFPLPEITMLSNKTEIVAGDDVQLICQVAPTGFYPFPRICARYRIRHRSGSYRHYFETDYSVFRAVRDYRLDVKLDYCGVYEIVCEELLAYDLFGIFARRFACPPPVNILVMPKEIALEADIEALGISEEKDVYNDPLAGDDVSEIRELRGYREGDRLSQVHWKLSGKSEDLIVKEYAKQAGACVALVCDGIPDGLSEITAYYELLYGFGRMLLESEIFFELVYYSGDTGNWERVRINHSYALKLAMEDMFFYQGKNTAETLAYSDDLTGASKLLCLTANHNAAGGGVPTANRNAAGESALAENHNAAVVLWDRFI